MTDHQLHSSARLTARFAWFTAKRLWHQAIADDIGEIVAGIWARTMLEALATYRAHENPVEISNPDQEPRPMTTATIPLKSILAEGRISYLRAARRATWQRVLADGPGTRAGASAVEREYSAIVCELDAALCGTR